MILVKTFFAYNDLRNFSYLILNDQSGDCWIIDPYEAQPMVEYIKKNSLTLRGILNTHHHFDHIRGNDTLIEIFKVGVCKVKNSENILLNTDYSLEVIDSPGHTMDHQVFVWKEGSRAVALFSGDTLFNSGVGNCKGGGDIDHLYQTTNMLLNDLPSDTLLYPGHDYRRRNLEFALNVEPGNKIIQESLYELKHIQTETLPPVTLGEEKKVNPFFRLGSAEIREKIKKNDKNEKEVFIELRHLRDHW